MTLKEFLQVFQYNPENQVVIRYGEPMDDPILHIIQYKGILYKMPLKYFDCILDTVYIKVMQEAGLDSDSYFILEIYLKENSNLEENK